MVDLLLRAGVCTEIRDRASFIALALAAIGGYLGIIKSLLQAGANTAAQNRDGRTPLAEANCRREDMVRLLLQY